VNITKAYFMVPVVDMERAVGFYRDVLGLSPGFVSAEWSELAWHDATIALHLGGSAAGIEAARESWLGLEFDDLDDALKAVEAGGGRRTTERDEAGARLVSVVDTEGNLLTLGQRRSWG
jgi:predicted enzyme related to lactoylglutathione lyase